MTKEEIIQEHQVIHAELTAEYYADPENYPGGKQSFDLVHGENWKHMDRQLIDEGYLQPPGPTIEDRVKALEDKQ